MKLRNRQATPPPYEEILSLARRRVASLARPQIIAWCTAICGHCMRIAERAETSADLHDDIAEIRMSGVSLLAIADELEKRHGTQ